MEEKRKAEDEAVWNEKEGKRETKRKEISSKEKAGQFSTYIPAQTTPASSL